MLRNWIVVCLAAVTAAAGAQNSDKLYQAIRANDLAGLNALLAGGANPNAAGYRGITPLMYAAEAGSLAATKSLAGRGADGNAQNGFGSTALMWSVADPGKVKLLLDHGAELARMLLVKGAGPKVVDAFGFTTLKAATAGNDLETIRMMVEAGVDVNAGERGAAAVIPGVTLLINAASHGNLEAVKLLLAKGADVNAVTTRDTLQKAKNEPIAIGGYTALMAATACGPAAMAKLLLEAGADPNVADIRGMTPLMLAAATDRHDPEIAMQSKRRWLLVSGQPGSEDSAILRKRLSLSPRSMDLFHGHGLGRERSGPGSRQRT
jgi:ankyrin repeat protein